MDVHSAANKMVLGAERRTRELHLGVEAYPDVNGGEKGGSEVVRSIHSGSESQCRQNPACMSGFILLEDAPQHHTRNADPDTQHLPRPRSTAKGKIEKYFAWIRATHLSKTLDRPSTTWVMDHYWTNGHMGPTRDLGRLEGHKSKDQMDSH